MSGYSPLADNVRRQIEAYVSENEISAGERLPSERHLAEHFGVSRTSLRKALATLEEQGVITSVHGSGTYLTYVSRQNATRLLADALLAGNRDLPEVVPIRSALESLAARLAAINRTPEDLEQLEEAAAAMERSVAAGKRGSAHSRNFHLALWRASKNSLLLRELERLQADFNRLRVEAVAQPQALLASLEDHAKILAAVRQQDSQAAAESMEEHILGISQTPLAQSEIPLGCI